MPKLVEIRRALSDHEPEILPAHPRNHAAVAIVLRETDPGLEMLFIERARRTGDPWSGHMAFPGGRIEPEDNDAREAAERETWEEVGLSLESAETLGRLTDLRGRHAGKPDGAMVISAFVYHSIDPQPLRLNHEVEHAFWFPVSSLLEAERHVEYTAISRSDTRFPGICVGDRDRHIVWGLTYRFLEVFLELSGKPLPHRWGALEPEGPR
jgi:8-oxo-dGTP pyrophosphatase MutT (NUDIX family)